MEVISQRQKRLAILLRHAKGLITPDTTAQALDVDKPYARTLLANWHKQGVLRRVAHGHYVAASPLDLGRKQVLDDPWILVPELFSPGYVGGWSAAEHWELTEQVFRSICILTAKRVSIGDREIQGVPFVINHTQEKLIFGTKNIWKDHYKILVSDPHKTILDILNNPDLGAGLQHTADCFAEYAKLYGNHRFKLIEYADQIGKGSLFKKLGYLGEMNGFDEGFLSECKSRLTTGYSAIDSKIENKKLVTRWRLWIPENWKSNDHTR